MSDADFQAVRRVVVALDARLGGRLLDLAADLAAGLEAELLGLFIEDPDLFQLAGLPFAHELRYPAVSEALDSARLARELRVCAARTRAALAVAADRRRLHWSFGVTRGRPVIAALEAAAAADVVLIGPAGAGPIGASSSLRLIYTGAPAARRALVLALRLARVQSVALRVAILGADGLAEQLLAQATAAGVAVRSTTLPAEPGAVAQWLQQGGGTVLVPGALGTGLEEEAEDIRRLPALAGGAVVVVF